MPIYFLLSIWVLLSVGREPTPRAYFERGVLFYNALTVVGRHVREVAISCGKSLSRDDEHRWADSPNISKRLNLCYGASSVLVWWTPFFGQKKAPSLDRAAALKMKESQCLKF